MPSAKSGTECSLVAPITPDDAKEAANADPGSVDAPDSKPSPLQHAAPTRTESTRVNPDAPPSDH